MSNLLELSGAFSANGSYVHFEAEIEVPKPDGPHGNYRCRVRSKGLLIEDMDVYGVTHDQAVGLAVAFLQHTITSFLVADDDGES